jgi:diguanylate cyclase (GGDEF)-like protein
MYRRTQKRGGILRGVIGSLLVTLAATGAEGSQPTQNIRFDRISREQGLSQSAINSIAQDRHGFMWFATEDGLNRYDGYTFTVFKHDREDPGSLSHDFVWSVFEDRTGTLWVGTDGGGLSRWNPDDDSFSHFRNDPRDPESLNHDRVRVLYEDREGTLWIGTDGGGLARFDRKRQKFVRFTHDLSNPESLSHDRIRSIHEDRDGALWIGTYGGGLNRFDRGAGRFVHYRHDPDDPDSLSDDKVYTIFEDRDRVLWIGTYGGGLDTLDRETVRFCHHRHDPDDPDSLAANRVRAIYQDADGTLWIGSDRGLNRMIDARGRFELYRNDPMDPESLSDDKVTSIFGDRGNVLWVGTKGAGLNKWNTGTGYFVHHSTDPSADSTLSSNLVTAFQTDPDGNLWIGTFGGGLNFYDRDGHGYRTFRHDPNDETSLSDDRVMSLLLSERGTLWVGTYENGLSRLDPSTGVFTHYEHDPSDADSLSANGIMSLHEDRSGRVWVGTFEGGLNRFDPRTGRFAHYLHDPDNPISLANNRVTVFWEESSGTLWVGTDGGGISRFDPETGTFSNFRNDPDDPRSLSNDDVWSILEDDRGAFWLGTQGGGLNRWDREDREANRAVFHHYTERDGLPNDHIYGIVPDDRGKLWLSTNKGLSRFDPRTGDFRNYDASHGLQSDEFNFGAYHRSASGQIYFGGINGYNAFYPERIRDNDSIPPVVLTSFMKFNRKVDLDVPVYELADVVLDYSDYVISFEFAALDFTAPEKNRYAYKLEGFDADWIDLGDMRRATYTNLQAGSYVFRVKGSNNDGVWNETAVATHIKVLPPPWKTWWAYTLYVLAIGAVVLGYTRAQARKLQREAEYSRKLEHEVQARTQELAQRNDELQVVNGKLEEASLTDSLTGLRNRRYLMTEIEKDIGMTERYLRAAADGHDVGDLPPQQNFLFLMIDLDGLKGINDVYGHTAGDMAILQMRDLLRSVCRKSDTIIRWGGDEFLVVGRSLDTSSAENLAERIRHTVAEAPFSVAVGQDLRLSCSIGFASYPFLPSDPTGVRWDQVLNVADRALYIAKMSGRNAWVAMRGTATTSQNELVRRINEETESIVQSGELDLRSSIEDPAALVWDRRNDRKPVRA